MHKHKRLLGCWALPMIISSILSLCLTFFIFLNNCSIIQLFSYFLFVSLRQPVAVAIQIVDWVLLLVLPFLLRLHPPVSLVVVVPCRWLRWLLSLLTTAEECHNPRNSEIIQPKAKKYNSYNRSDTI
jgi:hypothetical protein